MDQISLMQVTQMVTAVLDIDYLGHRLNWLSVVMVISNYIGELRWDRSDLGWVCSSLLVNSRRG